MLDQTSEAINNIFDDASEENENTLLVFCLVTADTIFGIVLSTIFVFEEDNQRTVRITDAKGNETIVKRFRPWRVAFGFVVAIVRFPIFVVAAFSGNDVVFVLALLFVLCGSVMITIGVFVAKVAYMLATTLFKDCHVQAVRAPPNPDAELAEHNGSDSRSTDFTPGKLDNVD